MLKLNHTKTKNKDEQPTFVYRTRTRSHTLALTKTDNIASEYVTEDLIGRPIRERTMKISENALKQLAIMFTDLYSNPIEAMVRETVSNATDATIKARRSGQDAPDVEIIRPALSEQSLTVIDHGVGMTQHELDIYFSDYGNSTKIDDMDAIGSKGLGAKAMLAYSPSAKVITVKDGTEIIMTMTRGEKDNFTSIESVTKTNKHNGTTIIIPVKSKDIDAVNEAIDRYARYAPAEAPITIDGIKHSLSERYVKLTDIKIGEDVDKTTGRVKPVMGAVWVRKDTTGLSYGSSYNHTPQISNNVSDAAIGWNETLDNVMKPGYDEKDGKWMADNYVRNNVCVTLSGWNYTLQPSSDREANRYHSSYSSYSSSNNQDSSYEFVVEIQPGVVNFPAHRDNIINDHRLEMLVDRIANGLRLRKTIVDKSDDGTVLGRKKNDNGNAVHLWDGIPEEMRVPLVSRLFDEASSSPWRKKDILTTWVSMDDVWPGVFEEFREDLHGDDPSFYGVVSYTTGSNWRNTKIVFDQQVSMINCVTHGKDPKNKTGRTYRTYNMIPIENKQMVPYLSLNEDYIEGERDSKSLNASILPFDAKRQLLYSDKTTYRGEQANSQMWNTIINDPSLWDYNEVRSIPVDFVIKSGDKRPYGVPATAADHWYLTIVQGDLGDWKNTKRKMGLLRRISRVRHEKGQQGHHVFYLVNGELDKKTLDKAVTYFKGIVNKSKENGFHSDRGTPVWVGVTTYDALKTEAAKFDASKRKLNTDPADNTTVYDVIPAAKWTVEDGDEWHVAAEMAHYVNRVQRDINIPSGRTTANVNEIIKAGDPVILFDRSTMKDIDAIKFSVFKTVVDEFGGLGSKTYWAISTSDVNAAFMNKLVKSPNVWVMDSTRTSFNNLKAVKSGGLMHVVKINETYAAGDIQRRGLQFLYNHVTPQDSFDVFSELFASSIPQLSRMLWVCIDGDDSVLFPHPDKIDDPKVKAMVELLSLGRASGWNDWDAIHKWIGDHETRDDLKSQELLRLMRAWELVFGYAVKAAGRSFYTSTGTPMDMARKAELQAFSNSFMNNYSLTYNCEAFMDKESDFTKQVHDGFLGMSLRAWWEALKK